jgi:hypothetical protein
VARPIGWLRATDGERPVVLEASSTTNKARCSSIDRIRPLQCWATHLEVVTRRSDRARRRGGAAIGNAESGITNRSVGNCALPIRPCNSDRSAKAIRIWALLRAMDAGTM